MNILQFLRLREANGIAQVSTNPDYLPIGSVVPALLARSPSGKRFILSYADTRKDTVVYVMSPSCSWCSRNEPVIRALAKQARDQFRFIIVSLSDDHNYAFDDHYPGFAVCVEPDIGMFAAYRFGTTPQTLVISPAGKVVRNWIGTYGATNRLGIEKFFGIKLPDNPLSSDNQSSRITESNYSRLRPQLSLSVGIE
jgi:hypothetical protein